MELDAPVNPVTAAEARLPGHWVSEEAQLEFFDLALARALEANTRAGAVTALLEVAGTRVELVFAGPVLADRFLPAMAHLIAAAPGEPDARFYVWDSASTGVAMAPPPCKKGCFTNRGDIWGMTSPRILSAFHWSEFSVNVMDLERRIGIFWVRNHTELPYWTSASPLRTLWHWWMERNGAQLLHAAAIGTRDGALLVTGKGGIGKSSTALACLEAGLQYVADDYLIVRLDPEPTAWSLYSTAKLDPGQVARFPALAGHIANPGHPASEKAVFALFPERREQVVRSLPLRAIATPKFVAEQDTSFGATESKRLERAALFTTMSQLPHAGQYTHYFIQRLVAALPRFEMRLGHDLTRIPSAVRQLLQHRPEKLAQLATPAETGPADQRPMISVIIPVYNGARFLAEAVDNVLQQGYEPLEIIVVDDGSTDDLDAAIAALPIEVQCLRQENKGPSSARNRGIREAAGELIALLDVDDLWPQENLAVLSRYLQEDPECDVVLGLAQMTRSDAGQGLGEFVGNPRESYPTYLGAALMRKRAFEKVGLLDTELRFGEDSDWFSRVQEAGIKLTRVDEVTLYVRRHDNNMTRGKSLIELNLLRVLKKQLDRQRMDG